MIRNGINNADFLIVLLKSVPCLIETLMLYLKENYTRRLDRDTFFENQHCENKTTY